jgi:hypothetical protein
MGQRATQTPELPASATPQDAQAVWERHRRPSGRGVARALTQAGRPVHFTTINRWRRHGWRAETTEHPLTQARDACGAATTALSGIYPRTRDRCLCPHAGADRAPSSLTKGAGAATQRRLGCPEGQGGARATGEHRWAPTAAGALCWAG